MKTVLQYRHGDGRVIEVRGDSSGAELWLTYPHRELLQKAASFDAGKEALPEGFALDTNTFLPPCPKCEEPSPMSPDTGMYVCRSCDSAF